MALFFSNYMNDYSLLIEDTLKKQEWNMAPHHLYEPIGYILGQGGKRIRPHLCLMAACMCGGNVAQAVAPALAFEKLHNFTLIHDDIMDKADIRRGLPTVYKKWDTNIAILSGDVLFAKAMEQMMQYEGPNKEALLQLLIRTTVEICEGQQYDLDFETMSEVSIDAYLEMIRLKTAVMLAACLKAGALTAQADAFTCDTLYNYGIQIGLAFQIQDDYLDVYADVAKFGKKVGGDIVDNKKTYMSLSAFQVAQGEDLHMLKQYFSSSDYDRQEKFEAVKRLYDKYKVGDKAKDLVQHYYNVAMNMLQQLPIADDKKQELRQFSAKLMGRDY